MYDDYEFKLTNKRITFKFIQNRDEPFYPWEIAKFINGLNTIYYKYELLNSISTALNRNKSSKNIIIWDKSLPLYENYSDLNLLNLSENGIQLLYHIGLPYSLSPNIQIERIRMMLVLFKSINKRLHKLGFKPLFSKELNKLYNILQNSQFDVMKDELINMALSRSKKDKPLVIKDFSNEIENINKEIDIIKNDFKTLKSIKYNNISDSEKKVLKKYDKRFLFHFSKLQRPLVCLIEESQLRIFGRSLVNKKEKRVHGLELKQLAKNSPLASLFESGCAAYRTIKEESRSKEIHQYELEIKKLEKEEVEERIKQEKLKTLLLKLEVAQKLNEIASNSDVCSIDKMDNSKASNIIRNAYRYVDNKRENVLNNRGVHLLPEETKVIDIKV